MQHRGIRERTCGRWKTSTVFSFCSIVRNISNVRGRAIPWIILQPELSSQAPVQGVARPCAPNRSNAGRTRVSRICDSKNTERILCNSDLHLPSVSSECNVGVGTKSMSFRKTNTPDGTCMELAAVKHTQHTCIFKTNPARYSSKPRYCNYMEPRQGIGN